tara:strand:+ start:1308 stop:1565 length:258 start_codon:yes stop_codon:yes gene_type:complete
MMLFIPKISTEKISLPCVVRRDLLTAQGIVWSFAEAYFSADVAAQWEVRQILSVYDHHHLDEVMVAWDDADSVARALVHDVLGAA